MADSVVSTCPRREMTVTQAVALQANGAVRSNEARLQLDELKHATVVNHEKLQPRDRTECL